MQFTYPHGIATVEQAMVQAVSFFTTASHPVLQGRLDAAFKEVADAALAEIRMILTAEMSTLFDRAGVAIEFNEAVELCIRLVEGELK